jgi:hypothetical protein
MHKVIQLISNFFLQQKLPLFMKVHVHWMNLMTNQIIQKCQNFEGKGCIAKESFF